MKNFRFGLILLSMEPSFFGCVASANPKEESFEKPKAVLAKYCYDCHGDGASKGDIRLDGFADFQSLSKDSRFWKRVWENLYRQNMPPARKPQPTEAEREIVLSWIERAVFLFDPSKPDPGRVTIRRLNRVEYDNVVRDLTGVDFNPSQDFPPDDTGHGFDTIGDALSLSPLLFEKYLAAANKILDRALGNVSPQGRIQRFSPREMAGDGYNRNVRVLSKEGEVSVKINFHRTGEYRFRAKAWATRAGKELAKMRFRLNGRDLKVFEVACVPPDLEIYEVKTKVERAGNGLFQVAFLNNFYDPKNPNLELRDRNLFLDSLEVELPPPEPTASQLASRNLILGERSKGMTDRDYAAGALRRFVSRAYRRSVPEVEIARLLKLFDLAKSEGAPFLESIRLPLQAVLASPHFLFRAENQPKPDDRNAVHLLDEYSLASRVSFFLWSTMPDKRLRELAAKGQLRDKLAAEVRRMLADEQSSELAKNFAGQWLQLRDLDLITPDPERFPSFDGNLRKAMRVETETFFLHLLHEDRPVTEFLNADYTFANASLARHYGLSGKFEESKHKRVSLKDRKLHRGGILTHASVLSLTSNPTRTSPVKRGKWVLDNILGTPPKEPPPDIPELVENSPRSRGKTLRDQLAAHSDQSLCASCHISMDAIGFALENYDAVGRWRERDAGKLIDASGKLTTGETFSGAGQLQDFIVRSRKDVFVRCFAENLLIYALGRGLEHYDRHFLDKIVVQVREHDYRFSELIVGIVSSFPFQNRRGDVPSL